MKKYILLFLMVFQFGIASEKDTIPSPNIFNKYVFDIEEEDCDACGCSASGGSMGFASMLNSNFVGIRYFNQQYKSRNGLYSNSPWYNENYNTTQIWARIPVLKNIQVSALIPYHEHIREAQTGEQKISGIGDITVMALYKLYQTHRDSTIFVHTLQMGGGVKTPTGSYDAANNSGNVNKSFQLGTGSWDFQLVSEYVIRRKKFGWNTMLNYTFKSENDKFYRYGNQFNYSGTFFYSYEKNKFSIVPQLGFAGEVYESNYSHKQFQKETAGDIVFGKFGFEIGREKLSFGANAMLPINQNLAAGNIEANYRWSINLNYSL
jgi:hypothetical protein